MCMHVYMYIHIISLSLSIYLYICAHVCVRCTKLQKRGAVLDDGHRRVPHVAPRSSLDMYKCVYNILYIYIYICIHIC